MRTLRRVCVYCASSETIDEHYRFAAREVGRLLAEQGIGVVFGGGRVGLMGEVASAALEAGGEVFGVIPHRLQQREIGYTDCTQLFVVDSMHARKMLMAQLSDAFIGLPGGLGTVEEILEVATWTMLRYHEKPVGLLNVEGYYDFLLAWLVQARARGFIAEDQGDLILAHEQPGVLLSMLQTVELPPGPKWLRRP